GKSYTNLADSLDTHQLFTESLKVREQAYREFGTFELLDAWCWTYWKAGFYAQDYGAKRVHLANSVELSEKLHGLRPTSRGVLKRWALVLRDLGELEYNHGNLAEAHKHASKAVEVAKMLATAPALGRERQSYARALFQLGEFEKKLGHDAEARKHFEHCRLIREELLRDYPDDGLYVHRKIDWLLALVALGEHVTAAKVADEIAPKYQSDNNLQFRLGVVYHRCWVAVSEARRPVSLTREDRQLQDVYRDKCAVCYWRAADKTSDREALER